MVRNNHSEEIDLKKGQMRSSLLLFLTAAIWGVAFVAQSVGMDYVGPFTFNSVRSMIGGLVLIPCIFLLNRWNPKEEKNIENLEKREQNAKEEKRTLLKGGILCGIFLFAASNCQQIGILYTSVGKAGFITACYIVLVPILGMFLGKKTRMTIWLSVVLAVIGLYFLCMTESLSLGKGDLLILLCALLFACHILVIDYFAPKVDGVKMSCIQFLVCGILSAVPMCLMEHPSLSALFLAKGPILYAGVLSCAVAYTLQIIGQKNMNPTVASLILSLESCISVLSGWVILHQKLSGRELFGCAIMFAAILIAQLPEKEETLRE
jgi:drug/metabolite transporter (DMT)-like permease